MVLVMDRGMLNGRVHELWLIVWMICLVLAAAPAHADPIVGLVKTLGTPGPVDSGATFTFNLAWSCPGSVSPADDCMNMRIIESLPLTLQATGLPAPDGKLVKVCVQNPGDPLPDFGTCTQPAVTTGSPTQVGATLHFVFVNRVLAGDSGSLQVMTRFPAGSTSDGTSATNTAEIVAECDTVAAPACSPATPVISTSDSIEASAQDELDITKTVQSAGAIGYNTIYRIRVRPSPDGVGYLTPGDVVVQDVLPAGATFVSANPLPNGGSGTAGDPYYWNLGALNSTQDIYITVNFPAVSNNPGDSRTNSASVDYTIETVPATTKTDDVTHTLVGPNPSLSRTKTTNDYDNVVNPAQFFAYTVRASNTGNIPLGVSIDDPIPPMCQVNSFTIGSDATALHIYRSNATDQAYVPGGVTNYTAAAVGADNSSVWISRIVVDYGDSGNPIVATGTNRTLVINCTALDPGWDGTDYDLSIQAGVVVPNTATIDGANGTDTTTGNVTRNVTLRDASLNPTIAPDASKSKTAPAGQVMPGENVTFSIQMMNSGSYSSALEQVGMMEPVFADLLQEGMAYVSSARTGASGASCASDPAIHTIADYNGTGRVLVVWDWSGTGCQLARGESVTYNLVAQVGDTTLAGSRTNAVAFLGVENPVSVVRSTQFCPTSGGFLSSLLASGTLDGATGTPEARRCHAGDTTFLVQRITTISSRKAVRGSLDPDWLYNVDVPNIVGRNVRENSVFWRLLIDNTANVPLDHIEIMDIVPFNAASNPGGTGNTGVGNGADMGSTWGPRFTSPIDLAAGGAPVGTKVYYTQAPSPCRDVIVVVAGCNPMTTLADGVPLSNEMATPGPGDAGEWSTVLPNDPSRVRAFRIVYPTSHVIEPGETLSFAYPMYVPADAPITDCPAAADQTCSEIAWNTFGFSYEEADIGLPNASAPTRVGVVVQPLDAGLTASLGDFVWHDSSEDGQQGGEESNGINNVLVELFRDPDGVTNNGDEMLVAATTTVNHPVSGLPGYYHFGGLTPTGITDRYIVRFHPPAGFTPSPANSGSDAGDSDGVDTVVGLETLQQVSGITLDAGEHDPTIDQGYFMNPARYSLGNRVWWDANVDSVDNDGVGATPGSSTGIAGVTVELWAVDINGAPTGGAPMATQVTNASGHYLFDDLIAGDYRVVIPRQSGGVNDFLMRAYSSGQRLDAAATLVEAAPVDGNSDLDTQDHGGVLTAALGAIAANSVVSGLVSVGPGSSEPIGEIGIKGPEQTPGYYSLVPDNRGNLSVDFGFYDPSVGNRVWFDLDNNGVLDGAEVGVAGVTVRLLDVNGVEWGSSVTDIEGHWRVDGLPIGRYRAHILAAVFQAGGPLEGYASSTGLSSDFTTAGGDNRDHGIDAVDPATSGVYSVFFDLEPGLLPLGETTSGSPNGGNGPLGDDTDQLTVDFGFYHLGGVPLPPYDPPTAIKTVTSAGLPVVEWRMVWFNPNISYIMPLQVVDPIPAGTTYVAGSLTCEARGASVQTLCEYDAVNDQVVFEGLIAPDGANNTEDTATNEVVITFRTNVGGASSVSNQGLGYWDEDGDGGVDGPVPTDAPDGPAGDPTTWSRPRGIPTLSTWGMLILSLLMLGFLARGGNLLPTACRHRARAAGVE